jgi:type I restriction enzyme R subunit
MALHNENQFEIEICQHLAGHGWEYAAGDAASYDRGRALFPADVLAWVQATQPQAWEALVKNHGAKAGETLLDRLRDQLDQAGTLEVLRQGIELLGLRHKLKLAEFKPALTINPEILARYAANRLRVVRQVRYSLHNENSIDLVLCLNGIPVATAELKTDFTQSVEDAVDQYKKDRQPQLKGQAPEPLLSFPQGALVHFAVSNTEVQMTTRLAGSSTAFLPFNQGNNGGSGNPPNPQGHPTAYLWEQVWERESWLEILGRYIVNERDKNKLLVGTIFPRYHQLDVTRKLQSAVLADGPGTKYLIQHSAGSGKTKSIAWTAHFLSELHDASQKKLFDSVLVVSDRTVIDSQLQETLFEFERKKGVVASISGNDASKSTELANALSGDKKIVVCTIQTFPFAMKAVRELSATEGKRFAVIADEAHSSQTGDAALKMKSVLSAEELADLNDGGEINGESVWASQMANRADNRGITFVAFTATPKSKTMELFGTCPDPTRKPAKDNVPQPFHVYSMRQAIEEGFILDVLQNYTPYKLAFRLAHDGKDLDDKTVVRSEAMKGIMGWVRLHPYNIAQKVQIVVEHFRRYVSPLLGGKGKAMVVTSSRLEAVRWQLAIQKFIKEKGYQIGTIVAFSGEVKDQESGPEPFTENSKELNPTLKGRDIREAFKGDEFQIMLVANKFQTGFDQPLLCGMYVDKRLAGVQAVQTLSRLNRAHPGKDRTYVVDFVNDPAEVLAAFKTYHTTAELADTTDPNLVFDLRGKLDRAGHYDSFEVDRVVEIDLNSKSTQKARQSEMIAALSPIVDRLQRSYKAAQEALKVAREAKDEAAIKAAENELNALILFKGDMGAFQRLYTFLSQIHDYRNTDIEKRSIFFKYLLPLLEFGREREGIDLSKVVLTHHRLLDQGRRTLPLSVGEPPKLQPLTETGGGSVQEKERVLLAEIIEKLNNLFGGETTDQDQLVYVNNVIFGKLLESQTLRKQAASNTKEQFANSPDLIKEIVNAIMEALDAHTSMSTQALSSPTIQTGIKDILLNYSKLYEALRANTAI